MKKTASQIADEVLQKVGAMVSDFTTSRTFNPSSTGKSGLSTPTATASPLASTKPVNAVKPMKIKTSIGGQVAKNLTPKLSIRQRGRAVPSPLLLQRRHSLQGRRMKRTPKEIADGIVAKMSMCSDSHDKKPVELKKKKAVIEKVAEGEPSSALKDVATGAGVVGAGAAGGGLGAEFLGYS